MLKQQVVNSLETMYSALTNPEEIAEEFREVLAARYRNFSLEALALQLVHREERDEVEEF
jgi:hypothetical protein